jgi:4-amino-4-deoxy-L-arabinose transferase-like glycosyltransferase
VPIRLLKSPTVGASAVAIFAAVLVGLLWLHGNRLVFSGDEGIILDAAARMVHGETLYRDFFGYMSPGSYWLQEAAFRVFGVSLWAGRVVILFDFALQCALLFWLTARAAGQKAGFAATVLFFAFQTAKPDFLLSQHRMDSAALSLASIALCLAGREGKAWCWWTSGVLIVGAAACTPSISMLALVTVVWLLADRPNRGFLIPYGCGLCLGLAALGTALSVNGLLRPLIEQMRWLGRNYSAVNIMPYGSIIGGYGAALGPVAGMDRVVKSLSLFCIALPAVLPVAALAAWSLSLLLRREERSWARDNTVPYLLACMLMYIGTTYPRSDVAHLAFVAVLPAALSAIWLARYAPPWLPTGIFAVLAVGAGVLLAQAASGLRNEVAVATPVGTLRVAAPEAKAVEALLHAARPRDILFVHPYMPLLYFLTQCRNPTRYSYLAPGMMTRIEEIDALDALKNSPPAWVLYLPVSREEFLRVSPHGTGLNHLFPRIEEWRAREYVPVEPPVVVAGYRLYEGRGAGHGYPDSGQPPQ